MRRYNQGADDRYRRAHEYVDVMRKVWAAEEPFSHDGDFYKFDDVRPNEMKTDNIRVHMGGASEAALAFGAAQADVYMLWGEPLQQVRERIVAIEDRSCRQVGRPPGQLSLRLRHRNRRSGWSRHITDPAYQRFIAKGAEVSSRDHAEDAGRTRQLQIAREGEMHDDCLWMGIVAAMNGLGNASALVGTEDRVMASLKAYRDVGVDTFLVAGDLGNWQPDLAPVVARMRREL